MRGTASIHAIRDTPRLHLYAAFFRLRCSLRTQSRPNMDVDLSSPVLRHCRGHSRGGSARVPSCHRVRVAVFGLTNTRHRSNSRVGAEHVCDACISECALIDRSARRILLAAQQLIYLRAALLQGFPLQPQRVRLRSGSALYFEAAREAQRYDA